MHIGELAQRTGTTPKAIRLYESRGLLGTVARASSYRHYEMKKAILEFCGIRPVRVHSFGPVRSASTERLALWVEKAQQLGQRQGVRAAPGTPRPACHFAAVIPFAVKAWTAARPTAGSSVKKPSMPARR